MLAWTGIPVTKLMEGEREKLLNLEDDLNVRVIGQDEAIEKVGDAIFRSRAGIKDATSSNRKLPIPRTYWGW